jgi:hypothetical protein
MGASLAGYKAQPWLLLPVGDLLMQVCVGGRCYPLVASPHQCPTVQCKSLAPHVCRMFALGLASLFRKEHA